MEARIRVKQQYEEDLKLQTRLLNKREMDEYWSKEFIRHVEAQNVNKGLKIVEEDAVTPSSTDVASALLRYQRVFGEIYDGLNVQSVLSKAENKEVRDIIEQKFLHEIAKNMERFLGMSFRQYATTIGLLAKKSLKAKDKFDIERIENQDDIVATEVREHLLSIQISSLDQDAAFAQRFRRQSELLAMSTDDMLESIR